MIGRSNGRRGAAILAAALDELEPTRSVLEREFVALVKAHGLPMPTLNTRVNGYEVDAYWPEHRLVVELDGHEFHRTRGAFERDRIRDAELQLAGYRVLRVTHRRLTTAPDEVMAAVHSLLGPGNAGSV